MVMEKVITAAAQNRYGKGLEYLTGKPPEFMQAQQAAYMEICLEDDEIAERMGAGRKALSERGDNETGPCQQPMETGMEHFHQWYRRAMGIARMA
jgi:hypothetical protein